eukprot:6151176-Pyramimonas_sp.AAC.1
MNRCPSCTRRSCPRGCRCDATASTMLSSSICGQCGLTALDRLVVGHSREATLEKNAADARVVPRLLAHGDG